MPDRAAVNAHTHLYSGLAPLGMPAPAVAPQNFLQILERIWWRLDRALDAASLRASARYYVADALLAGTPVLIDHHESPSLIEGSLDILADACAELGARALLCYGATERNGGRDEARRGLAECRRFITSNLRPGIAGAVALHASFTVSDETIAEAMAMAKELGAIVHVHVAEDRADVADAKKRGYDGPLERLLAFGIPAGSILAHGVHLDEKEIHLANETGLWIVQNPRSNAGNHVGYPAAIDLAANVALGTDGFPARMRDEMTLLEESEPESEILRRVSGGARLARQLFGELEEVIVRRDDRVESLIVNGREVVRGGRLVSGDIEEIRAHANEQATRLWKRM
ncbi:MAG: amidohydrolase family protein [Thermoanaerobaculia bacterium]